ncbi:MAG TPA: alanine racemase [Pseudolysinimonas sp.]|nr:alanine racemase [Pseudolysinimonas sp.]
MSEHPPPTGRGLREARIDLGAVRSNIETLRALVAPALTMAVVKADAYGHGALGVARAAVEAGADWLGVADLEEALALRAAGIDAPMLAWLHAASTDFVPAVDAGVDLGISTLDQLDRAAAAGATVQLKLNTGLSRNGFEPEEAPAAFARAVELGVRVRGIFSHLSNTSRADDDAQLALFEALLSQAADAGLAPELRHLAATEAAITRPELRFDLVRTGIGMYGLPAADGVDAAALGLRPVMTLAGTVANVRRVEAGAGVSYGFTHRTQRPTTLALVPLGYADGVPRAASNRAEVLIGGTRHPVVGRIAMDQFVVDVGDSPVRVGDQVVLWGDSATGAPSVEEWAAWAGTINYEIVTRVGPRIPRIPVP